jgi:predicted DNA-binding transcriptional regulator AlpA
MTAPPPVDLTDPTLHAVSLPEAAQLLGLSPTSMYRAARRGAVPTIKVLGTRRLIVPTSWLRAQLGVEVRAS